MVGDSAKKLNNLDVRFVCNFISKKFLSLENRGSFLRFRRAHFYYPPC